MIKKIIYLLFLIVTLSSDGFSQEAAESFEARFKKASEYYSAGKYQDAYDIWINLYNSGQRTASLNYNIGNACFKLNNIPGSILFYERALLLKPADEDINYNLQIARTLVVDKFAEIPELFFITWFSFISLSLSSDTWAMLSIIAFILSLLLISVYFYSARYRYKVLGFWFALFMFFSSLLAVSFSIRNKNQVYNSDKAIIFSPLVNGKSSPGDSGNDLFVLHEGTKVTIEDEVGGWNEIRLSDGNKGWVPSNSLSRL